MIMIKVGLGTNRQTDVTFIHTRTNVAVSLPPLTVSKRFSRLQNSKGAKPANNDEFVRCTAHVSLFVLQEPLATNPQRLTVGAYSS